MPDNGSKQDTGRDIRRMISSSREVVREERSRLGRLIAARWLTAAMNKSAMNENDLVVRSGVSAAIVRRMIQGRTANLCVVETLAKTLGVPVPTELSGVCLKRHQWGSLRELKQKYPNEYIAFCNMHQRVSNPAHPKYPLYGERGVTIHATWAKTPEGFAHFMAHMGPRPSAVHSLHRSPANANYGPGTCKWATPKEQSIEQRGKLAVEWSGTLVGRTEFERLAVSDGFLYVIKRNADGSLKETRTRSRNKRPETDISDQE